LREVPALSSMAAVFLVALSLVACETVPYTGRSQLQLISPQEEGQMGVQAYQQILGKAKVSSDGAANEMVTRAGKRIAAVSGHPEYQWEDRLIQEAGERLRSSRGQGRRVYRHPSCDQGRDRAGHGARPRDRPCGGGARGERMSQQMGVNAVVETLAGLPSGNPAVVQSVSALLGAGASVGVLLPWGRAQESEAEHLGLILMAKAGYDPHAARDLWVRMADLASKTPGRPPEFLSTHPSETTRIAQI